MSASLSENLIGDIRNPVLWVAAAWRTRYGRRTFSPVQPKGNPMWTRSVTIQCEAPGCPCKIENPTNVGVNTMRNLAKSLMWTYTHGLGDLCPLHSHEAGLR